jgi:hypothetical protein
MRAVANANLIDSVADADRWRHPATPSVTNFVKLQAIPSLHDIFSLDDACDGQAAASMKYRRQPFSESDDITFVNLPRIDAMFDRSRCCVFPCIESRHVGHQILAAETMKSTRSTTWNSVN